MPGPWESVFWLLAVNWTVGNSGELTERQGNLLHADESNFTKQDLMEQQAAFEPEQQDLPGSTFNLRVHVNDMLSRQPLSQAAVELFVNHTSNGTVFSEDDGSARLLVPFHLDLPVTVVAAKRGFISTLLPCKTSRTPIFSSVTMSLLPLNQGNIWLFEDWVLITGRGAAAAASQPTVRFPQRLLNLTHSRNITAVRSYLTVPKLTEQDGSLDTLGIVSSNSKHVNVELRPVAAVSVELLSGDVRLQVSGPIQISLGVPENRALRDSDVVPAWFFNRTAGGWTRKGLGKMKLVDGKLTWTFTAPHLGYWIAAPLTSTRDFPELSILIDFVMQHSLLLMFLVGGVLTAIVCLLIGLLCYCCGNKSRQTPGAMRKDQTTSTGRDESETSSQFSHGSAEVIPNPGAVVVSLEDDEPDSEGTHGPASLFFHSRPVAVLPAASFFHQVQSQRDRSATLLRVAESNGTVPEPRGKESFTQTLGAHDRSSAESPGSASGTPSSLPESASVPGTLNELSGSRRCVHAITGPSKNPSSPQPPRAWFVSLEGKPAAEIRYAVSETQRRRRPLQSRETSLDSGVDLSELNQTSGRRPVALERNATFIKSSSSSKPSNQE